MRRTLALAVLVAALGVAIAALPRPDGVAWLPGTAIARAASPSPEAASPGSSSGTGDTRTTGEAPGFVGAPVIAVLVVLGLGGGAALLTIGYVRLTGGPRSRPG